MIKKLFFKATNKQANACPDYQQIKKRGSKSLDYAFTADDVIIILIPPSTKQQRIIIDCDKKTKEFALSKGNW